MQDIQIHISTSTLLKIVGFVLLLYVLFLVWNILLLVFVAIILAALIEPFVAWSEGKKIPRSLSVLTVYVLMSGFLIFAIAVLTPVIAQDLPQLAQNAEHAWVSVSQYQPIQTLIGSIKQVGGSAGFDGARQSAEGFFSSNGGSLSGLFSKVTGFFGGVFSLVIVLVITFYLVVQDETLAKLLRSIVPDEYIPYLSQLFRKMHIKLGGWLRGQLVLSAAVGILVFIGLSLLGVKYAAVLGLLAALLEFIPYLGPIFASIPALLFSFSQGGMALFVVVLLMYVVIQQVENHILIPKIMQKAVGLNPIISIIAILIGAQLAGVGGALFAIPVATALHVFLKDVFEKKQD